MIDRTPYVTALQRRIGLYRMVALVGPPHSGKTTIVRALARAADATYVDLRGDWDPRTVSALSGLVILDHVDDNPSFHHLLSGLASSRDPMVTYVAVGYRRLAPAATITLPGLSVDEVEPAQREQLWLRGGLPASFTAADDAASFAWRQVQVARIGDERLLSMLAHAHGQPLNASVLARSLGVSAPAVRRRIAHLVRSELVRPLTAWREDLPKRQVRAPTLHLTDSGLLHAALAVSSMHELRRHPALAASWEGFGISTVISRFGASPEECFHWSSHQGARLPLLIVRGTERLGFAFHPTVDPPVTRSLQIAIDDLKLDRLDVITPRNCLTVR